MPAKKYIEDYEREATKVGACLVHPWMKGRRAYIMRHGVPPNNLFVCHTCDVQRCILDKHHFLGTHADNMADCKAKGRMKAGHNKPEVRKKKSVAGTATWKRPEFRATMRKATWDDPAYVKKQIDSAKANYANPTHAAKMAAIRKKKGADPEFRAKMRIVNTANAERRRLNASGYVHPWRLQDLPKDVVERIG
jgi:hypothetical protein